MKIPHFALERQQKMTCGSILFPLLFEAFKVLWPVVDPTGLLSLPTVGLLAVYAAGLLLLDRQRSACWITRTVLPTLSHDRMTALLRWVGQFTLGNSPFSTFAVRLVQAIVAATGMPGLLILDDTMLPKLFAKAIWGVHRDRDPATGQVVPGIRMVWVIWTNGLLVIPLGFLIWHKRGHLPEEVRRYRTKNELARVLLWTLHAKGLQGGLHVSYLLFDGWYCTKANLRLFQRVGFFYITRFSPRYTVTYQGRVWLTRWLAWPFRKSSWHWYGAKVGYIKTFSVTWAGVGPLKLAILKATRHQKPQARTYLISNAPTLSHLEFYAFRPRRWTVDVFFRTAKQVVGWGHSPARSSQTVVGHLVLGAIAYTILEVLCPQDAFGTHGSSLSDRFHIARRDRESILEEVRARLQALRWVHVEGPLLPWGDGVCAVAVEEPEVLFAPFCQGRLKGIAWKQMDFWALVSGILVGTRLWALCQPQVWAAA